jgi:hypothetical protein
MTRWIQIVATSMVALVTCPALAEDSAPCAPCSTAGGASAEPAKTNLIETLNDKVAAVGLNGAVRWGGLWPAEISLGAHWYMRQYFAFARRLGLGMDVYFFSPAYGTSLYGYPVHAFDVTVAGRACFTPGPVDFCGSLGFSDPIIQINVGPPIHNVGAFASLHPSFNLGILPALAANISMDIGYYFKRDRLLIANNPAQSWEPSPWFWMVSVGLAYRETRK